MNINLEKKENKIILKVALKFRGKRGETRNFTNADAKNWITQNNPEIKLGNIVSAPSKPINNVDRLTGVWTFELQKEKPVDIPKKSVIIDEPKIEAEHPIIEEPKEEASLFSEPLPYGLKSTATKTKAKKKRTTKKKKIEE
jgi:hypothetical protein